MPESSLTPGKSLESDLRLIREARGLSREDIYNRVHIRPEVLAQVEEHGFSATPTLSFVDDFDNRRDIAGVANPDYNPNPLPLALISSARPTW